MTKKNIRPQQAAPVQRETVGTNSETVGTGKMTASMGWGPGYGYGNSSPFGGDDAE